MSSSDGSSSREARQGGVGHPYVTNACPGSPDDEAACMVVDKNIFVMLLAEARFRDFITGEISDATKTTEVLTCLSADSKEHVDETVAKAIAAGGKAWPHVRRELPQANTVTSGGHPCGFARWTWVEQAGASGQPDVLCGRDGRAW